MKYFRNNILNQLLFSFGLSSNLDFSTEIPCEIQEILNDGIIVNEFWIGLKKMFIPTKDPENYGQSYYEDTNYYGSEIKYKF